MNVKGRKIWQQAAGDTDRDYAELCLKWDVILNGPARYGRWPECKIRWFWSNIEKPKHFQTYTLKQGDTTQLLNNPSVNSWIRSLEIPDEARNHIPVELASPSNNAEVSVDDVSEYLFGKGVANASISNLLNEIGEFIRIANWYDHEEQKPSESETVNYLVVPLLRALGWTPQRMAIEWNKIDIALFSSLPRKEDFLSVVVEAKKMRASCLSAFSQAKDYALDSNGCGRIIVTNGLRYGVFTRDTDKTQGKKDFSLFAYMNLTRLRREYPIYDNCKGARDALLAMAPEWQ